MPLNNVDHLYGKVAIFIDAANIIHCYEDTKWKIDLKKLKKYFESKCTLVGIYYYSAYFEESVTQQGFFEMLSRKGFVLRLKKIKKIRDKSSGEVILKGNCDACLVVDAVSIMDKYDTAVFMSGDGDYVSLVNLLKGKGKKVIVISTRWHVAKDLIDAANFYFDFNKFKPYWELVSKP